MSELPDFIDEADRVVLGRSDSGSGACGSGCVQTLLPVVRVLLEDELRAALELVEEERGPSTAWRFMPSSPSFWWATLEKMPVTGGIGERREDRGRLERSG